MFAYLSSPPPFDLAAWRARLGDLLRDPEPNEDLIGYTREHIARLEAAERGNAPAPEIARGAG